MLFVELQDGLQSLCVYNHLEFLIWSCLFLISMTTFLLEIHRCYRIQILNKWQIPKLEMNEQDIQEEVNAAEEEPL